VLQLPINQRDASVSRTMCAYPVDMTFRDLQLKFPGLSRAKIIFRSSKFDKKVPGLSRRCVNPELRHISSDIFNYPVDMSSSGDMEVPSIHCRQQVTVSDAPSTTPTHCCQRVCHTLATQNSSDAHSP